MTVDDTLYVATTGSNSNVGSQTAPLLTIAAAVAKTGSLSGVLKLHVAEGSYNGTVAVVDDLTISGGYPQPTGRGPAQRRRSWASASCSPTATPASPSTT